MAHSRWRRLPNICLAWAHDGRVCILPISLYWPMMAISIWRWLPNICLVWAHDGHMCILPNSLHRPMMAICIFYRQACIGPIQPIVYATIYTSGPIGGACVTADDIMMAKSR